MDADLQLLEAWRGGQQRAGEELFGRHFGALYRFFEHRTGGEADELVQATFLHCVRARDQFLGQSSFRTYLFSIARRELYRSCGRGPERRTSTSRSRRSPRSSPRRAGASITPGGSPTE